jgi:hypothetical protein
MNVDKQILQIISVPSFDSFTTFELKKAVEEKFGEEHFGIVEVFKFVRAQMKLLVQNGLIERSRTEHIFSGIYTKVEDFDVKKISLVAPSPTGLKDKHKSYKQQLLVGLGEVQEYQQLCKEYPELRNELQPKYNKIRDQNSRVLGKIKVIESLLDKTDTY